ncbi:unnamed protein product, partial [Urochloa humidicola]
PISPTADGGGCRGCGADAGEVPIPVPAPSSRSSLLSPVGRSVARRVKPAARVPGGQIRLTKAGMMRREVEAGRPVVGGAHGRRREARQGRGRPARGEARGAGGRHLARGPAAGVTLSSPASSGPPSGNISSSPFLPHRPAAAMAHVRIKSRGLHSPGGGDSGCQAEVTPATRWLTSLRHQPRHPYPRAPAHHRHICRSCSGPHRPDPARVTAAGRPISGGGGSTPR